MIRIGDKMMTQTTSKTSFHKIFDGPIGGWMLSLETQNCYKSNSFVSSLALLHMSPSPRMSLQLASKLLLIPCQLEKLPMVGLVSMIGRE